MGKCFSHSIFRLKLSVRKICRDSHEIDWSQQRNTWSAVISPLLYVRQPGNREFCSYYSIFCFFFGLSQRSQLLTLLISLINYFGWWFGYKNIAENRHCPLGLCNKNNGIFAVCHRNLLVLIYADIYGKWREFIETTIREQPIFWLSTIFSVCFH